MEIESNSIRPLKDMLAAHGRGSYPPRPLLEAMHTLLGAAEVLAGLGARTEDGRWGCLVVTEDHIVYGEAARDGDPDYGLGSNDQAPSILTAHKWRRDQLAKLSVLEVRDDRRDFGTSWSFDARLGLTMQDGTVIALPSDGQFAHYNADAPLQALVHVLRS